MTARNIIPFEPQSRLLEKARAIVAEPERFLEDAEAVISLLTKAFRAAEPELKQQIVFLLGSFPKDSTAWPLYRIMADTAQEEDIRHIASIQLNVVTSFLDNPAPLVDQLLEDLGCPDPQTRSLAAFALGWEGNESAAVALIELLYDADPQVQVTAVNALSNLQDDRVLQLLAERLRHGPLEQKRTILYNLWRFSRRKDAVAAIYLDFLANQDEELRYDALTLLDSVAEAREHIRFYGRCLGDRDSRIRALALGRLETLDGTNLVEVKDRIEGLRADPDPEVKALALRILKRF